MMLLLPLVAGACERYTPVERVRESAGAPRHHSGDAEAEVRILAPHGSKPGAGGDGSGRFRAGRYSTSLAGRYEATWIRTRAFLQQIDGVSDCLTEQTCTTDLPPEPEYLTVLPAPVPSSFLRLRVVEQDTGREATCVECDPGEFYLAPHGRYELQAVVNNLKFIAPPEVDLARLDEIRVGPIGSAAPVTGVDRGLYVHCLDDTGGRCQGRRVYQLYDAALSATIEIDRLSISAKTSAFPGGTPRTPLPPVDPANGSALSEPVITSFTWTTQENAVLPDPGPGPI
jgi:hypothetical protein